MIGGKVVDLTKEQYDYDLDYSKSKQKQPDITQAQTKKRYELLKARVENYKNYK